MESVKGEIEVGFFLIWGVNTACMLTEMIQ